MAESSSIKVYLVCTGLGIVRRGVESFMQECFEALRGREGLHIELFKGAGEERPNEHLLSCLPRSHLLARLVGRFTGRTGHMLEQVSAFPSLRRHIRAGRPDIVFFGNGKSGALLCHWLSERSGTPFRVLFSNASPDTPPFPFAHHVQQLNPWLFEKGKEAGEPPERQSLVPYGIHVPEGPPASDPGIIREIRRKLHLPLDRQIVLSVGWISRVHKRMDYTVNEIAAMPEPRPYLVMLGQIDHTSAPVLKLAQRRLGPDNFTALTVPYESVVNYYRSADAFVLSSLCEAFGRVYLEALIEGLPCVVNDHPLMRYVLDKEGIFADLSKQGALSAGLHKVLATPNSPGLRARRRESVRRRFDWEVLAPAYLEMFRRCVTAGKPTGRSERFKSVA
jgi:1,2-diacylglycerol 3-alpha-glucosyltransferase